MGSKTLTAYGLKLPCKTEGKERENIYTGQYNITQRDTGTKHVLLRFFLHITAVAICLVAVLSVVLLFRRSDESYNFVIIQI